MDWARRDQSLTIRRGRNEDSWTGFGFWVTRNSHACLEGETPRMWRRGLRNRRNVRYGICFFSPY